MSYADEQLDEIARRNRVTVVRGWLLVGDEVAAADLPPGRMMGRFTEGGVPLANVFQPGDWIIWLSGHFYTLVCVEVPLA